MLQFNILQRLFGSTGENAGSKRHLSTNIPPVETLQIDYPQKKRDRALIHLLRLNHHSHSVLYPGYKDVQFHNHCPHALGSAFLFGADEQQLREKYEEEDKELERWKDSPCEVTETDWRDYLGDHRYQRAYLDFFEDELVRKCYDWKKVLLDFMLQGEKPLVNSLICGVGHPFIHFGYAIELNSREVAMEALTLAATCYDFLTKYTNSQIYPATETSTKNPMAILNRVREDIRFDGLCEAPGQHNRSILFKDREGLIVEYCNQLDINGIAIETLLELLTKLSVTILTTTHKPGNPQYDFFICHAVTVSYAARTVLPILPASSHRTLLRNLWFFILLVYLTQMRPSIKPELVEQVQTKGRGWEHVINKAIANGGTLPDTHYMKALRAMRDSAKLYTHDDLFYLKAALKFAYEYENWIGFEDSKETLDIKA
ncbi:hypothetical protein BDZ91DRAFT_739290 [Kalaharituber pfeilii]|nr:hypothetical protein BDZ91DRAFT_739290 [Kalaharituber pfeilii]